MGDAGSYLELILKDPYLGRMLASYERAAENGQDLEALDYGCGYGWGSYVLAGACRKVTGYDPDKDRISFARSIFIKDNILFCGEEQELANQSYDMACLFMVLPHVKEAEKLLEGVGKYIKQGGILRLSYKSDNRQLPGILEQWEAARGFRLLVRREQYLTGVQNLVECNYCKER